METLPSQKYPDDYPAPRQFALVISCIDYRLLDDLVRFLAHENLTNRYYHLAFAGASLMLSHEIEDQAKWPAPKCGRPTGGPWWETLHAHLEAVIALTGGRLSDVYIVEHRDCGAYTHFLGADYSHGTSTEADPERDDHAAFALALRSRLETWFRDYLARVNTEQKQEPKPTCPKQPLPHAPTVRCFMMGLRGEVIHLDADEPAKGKRKGHR